MLSSRVSDASRQLVRHAGGLRRIAGKAPKGGGERRARARAWQSKSPSLQERGTGTTESSGVARKQWRQTWHRWSYCVSKARRPCPCLFRCHSPGLSAQPSGGRGGTLGGMSLSPFLCCRCDFCQRRWTCHCRQRWLLGREDQTRLLKRLKALPAERPASKSQRGLG